MSGGYPAREKYFSWWTNNRSADYAKNSCEKREREREEGHAKTWSEQNVENETIARGILRGGITTHRDARFESN